MSPRPPPSEPPDGPALADPATANAARTYRLKSWGAIPLALAMLGMFVYVLEGFDYNPPGLWNTLAIYLLAFGGVLLLGSPFYIARAAKMRRILASNAWVEHRSRFRLTRLFNSHFPQLFLMKQDGTPEVLLHVMTVRWRAAELEECDGGCGWRAMSTSAWS